ncbi:MAG: hypothetical protein C5B52_17835 [Bacteroidetes bacterium]|nr:MAG: hypothetical protein C5B52_17835 [Bacteroidota bacterium]
MRYLNKLIPVLGLVALVASCQKDDVNKGTPNNESTILKLPQGDQELFGIFFDPVPADVNVNVLEVRRDVKSEADLNKTAVVKIQQDEQLLADYNDANGTDLETFTAYTLDPSTPFDGTNWTVTFNPGEFVKYIKISFNTSLLDFTTGHAIGFKVSDAGGMTLSSTKSQALIQLGVKNQYDGLYHSNGVFHHPVNGDRVIDEDKYLATVGPSSVKCNLGDLGGNGYQMILTVNADNTVTIDPAGATPNIDQHWGPNYYDPATKSFHLFYSYNTAAPRKVEETITMK